MTEDRNLALPLELCETKQERVKTGDSVLDVKMIDDGVNLHFNAMLDEQFDRGTESVSLAAVETYRAMNQKFLQWAEQAKTMKAQSFEKTIGKIEGLEIMFRWDHEKAQRISNGVRVSYEAGKARVIDNADRLPSTDEIAVQAILKLLDQLPEVQAVVDQRMSERKTQLAQFQ